MVLTHSGVDHFNRYLNTTVGREKLCRLVQYFARFYAFYLFRSGAPKDTIQRWVDLKTHLGNGRKFFRLLKPVEFAQTGVKSLTIRDEVLRYTSVAKQIGMAFYYLSEVFVLVSNLSFFFFFSKHFTDSHLLYLRQTPSTSTSLLISRRLPNLVKNVGLLLLLHLWFQVCTSSNKSVFVSTCLKSLVKPL